MFMSQLGNTYKYFLSLTTTTSFKAPSLYSPVSSVCNATEAGEVCIQEVSNNHISAWSLYTKDWY